jgi:hypothetical protein
MDLQRELELDFLRQASRFEAVAPGWKDKVRPDSMTKVGARNAFFQHWLDLTKGLGFQYSFVMPLMTNSNNGPLYRMVFLFRHKLAQKIWDAIARPNQADLFQ